MNDISASKQKMIFALVTTLFFLWGFITCMNDILIPYLKKVFELNYAQAMLVQLAFFGAYFIGSLLYFFISSAFDDPINKIGYRKGIVAGLLLSAIGCLLFYPAANMHLYGFFLAALFVLGLGFTILQIAANPYVAILGSPETASSRLNLSQGFNSFGTTIAPIVGGYLVFHFFAQWGTPLLTNSGEQVLTEGGTTVSASSVQLPYLIFAGVFILMALVFAFSHLPRIDAGNTGKESGSALKYRHLILGIIAIFFYVGSEVAIGSTIINYLNDLMGYAEMEAKLFLAFYWGGAMIGRFIGAISLNDMPDKIKKILWMAVAGILGFVVIYSAGYIESGLDIQRVFWFLVLMAVNFGAFMLGRSKPARTLGIFCLFIISLLLLTVFSTGELAMWAIIGIGLFNSIMWSNIFTLAIDKLGKHTSQGSSLLVMAILGGALLPPFLGIVADQIGLQMSYLILIIPYAYLAFYGFKGYKPRSI
ncbi:MAG TPA: sugar MFS transporter [Bacteroidales bacterium]|nr:sugar MFS transporter [Bacteroidales bacterium]